MGAGFHGGFGRTKGGRTIYEGTSKSSALSSVSSLPKKFRVVPNRFLKAARITIIAFQLKHLVMETIK